jgi:uncharacterized secreted protein with C-terminal beta-propeller domain
MHNSSENVKDKKTRYALWAIVIATLLLTAGMLAVFILSENDRFEDYSQYQMLKRFSSYPEFNEYIKDTQPGSYYQGGWGGDVLTMAESPGMVGGSSPGRSVSPTDYSGTNVQVEGVNEADIVKTDGDYIYVVSGDEVVIVDAYPPQSAEAVSNITIEGFPLELFVNGNRLVVFENVGSYDYYGGSGMYVMDMCYDRLAFCGANYYNPRTSVKVYDITSRENPTLFSEVTVNGTYYDSRMIDGYVYVVVTHYFEYGTDYAVLPVFEQNGVQLMVKATEIGYFDVKASSYILTTVFSVNVNMKTDIKYDVFLTDATQALYATSENLYLTSTEYVYRTMLWSRDGSDANREKTWIHRIGIDSGRILYSQSTRVPGTVLNQFSMDEYNGYFRIATTTGQVWDNSSETNIYVLDGELNLEGKLEGLAPTERIYSARFMGDRCYLVTFRQVDPFFVIDLSNPKAPVVLGELKIAGYSDYLHPYDENHVIGLGKEDSRLKLSLFDVTDVKSPSEVSRYLVGDDEGYSYSDSYALNDHKAFLFSKSKDLLVIPVSVSKSYKNYWQGAYVFKLTLENGFELEGEIDHHEDDSAEGDNPSEYYMDYYDYNVKRSLYIEDGLYTISNDMIKINGLADLSDIKDISI